MQEVTPWPDSFDVSEPVVRVLVDGQEADVESVTVASELGSAMPERVVAGGGMAASTGDASILRPVDMSDAGFNPWGDAGRFAAAQEVVVEAGYRDSETGRIGCARQMTAQVDALDGGALSNAMNLRLVDHTPSLDRNITIEPLMQQYPPLDDRGPRLGAGLSPFYVTNRVLRHCGFYSTPPMISQALVSAPLFGSGVAERGTLFAAEAASGAPNNAAFQTVPWGLGLADGVLSYTPTLGSRGHARLTSTLHVSFHRAAAPVSSAAPAEIVMRWGSWDDSITIQLNASGAVYVRYRVGGSSNTVLLLSAAKVGDAEAFTVLVSPSGQVTVYASNGVSETATAPLPGAATSQNMDQVRVTVPDGGCRLGGVQVAFSATRNENFVRSAHIESPIYWSTTAFPSQIDTNCLDLLKAHAEAELAAIWIDEAGHFRWRNRQQLAVSVPVGTLTSTSDLLDLSWEFPVRSVFSRVEFDHDAPSITRRLMASVTVSDGRGSSLANGESEERFFEPPADEDWHMVEAPQWLGGTIDSYHLIRGRGSFRGGVILNGEDEERMAYSANLTSVWSQINPQRWLLSSTVQGLSTSEYVEQRFRDRPDLYGRFAGENLPLIRAKGLVQWESQTTAASHRGPRWAPVFTHKVGPWIQNQNALDQLADFLGQRLTQPEPILRDVPIVPDPRIQLGDAFWLEDRSAFHVRLRVVVMGKKLSIQHTGSGNEMTQSITCRVVSVQRLKTTYDELQDAWENQDYAAFDAAWADTDYDDLAASPLGRS